MILDRSKAPGYKVPEDFELLHPLEVTLANGAKFFYIATPGLNAVKIEILGKSQRGTLPLDHTLVSSFTLQLLQEGTSKMDSGEISNLLDFHASELHPILTFGHEGIGLLSTRSHFNQILPVLTDLFTEAVFPETILAKKKSQMRLSLALEKEKTSSRAGQLFRKCLFGPLHPYGVQIEERHVDIITPSLLDFYYKNQLWQNLEIFVTGSFDGEELLLLQNQLAKLPNRTASDPILLPEANSVQNLHEARENAVQSSIRIGKLSIPNSHPDYMALSIFNTILGGYFGSRLIKNIREDKGHTYGIHSSLAEIGDLNYWDVSADVQKAYYLDVIKEIHHEIEVLCTVPIDMDELEVVRNYMIGQMLKQFSSSFDLMDRFRAAYHSHLTLDYYQKKLDFLKSFTAKDILEVGQRHFSDRSSFVEVVVG